MPLPTGVTLFTSVSPEPADRTLLVVHGGPDWDHTYLREPLSRLAGDCPLVLPDLRGCGRSTTGLDDRQYTPDLVVGDLLALLDHLGVARAASWASPTAGSSPSGWRWQRSGGSPA